MNTKAFLIAGTTTLLAVYGIHQVDAAPGSSGAIFTTDESGTALNWKIYPHSTDVYLNGGPDNRTAAGLPDGNYYFQVTDPGGDELLSTDDAECRQLIVVGGRVAGAAGPCSHLTGTPNPDNGVTPVQLAPFLPTPNSAGVHKVWLVPADKASIGDDPRVLDFARQHAKTGIFKVAETTELPVGSCQPANSLSVLASGSDVIAYVPKGNWRITQVTGIAVVNLEGSAMLPTVNPIPTTNVVNSCASNSVTGQTVCTANNNDIYVIGDTTATPPVTTLTSDAVGSLFFSGGTCINCNVAMDAVHNKAAIGLALGAGPTGGFQFLDIATNALEPAFATKAPGSFPISEAPLIDPLRDLLLNPTEANEYELIDIATSTSPAFFENSVAPLAEPGVPARLDSAGEDCETGIVLAPFEFLRPSQVYIANLSSTSATFTPGVPGSWSAPSQVQVLSESYLAEGANAVAVAQGTHTGVLSGEFGLDYVTAIALPAEMDTSSAIPAISDWVSCRIGGGFQMGYDPHTVSAYQSPANGHAIAILANGGATMLAVVDLTSMLDPTIVPRTVGGHACASVTLPAAAVSVLPIP
jgi:hypothetical protein